MAGADPAQYGADAGERAAAPLRVDRCLGVHGKVVLDFFVRGGAAHFDQAAQHNPGAGHHGSDGFEQHPLRPALPQVLAAQAHLARPGRGTGTGASGQLLATAAGVRP